MLYEQFAERIKRETALNLFRDGAISSGIAASWVGIPRTTFLRDAMQRGADNSADYLRREDCVS